MNNSGTMLLLLYTVNPELGGQNKCSKIPGRDGYMSDRNDENQPLSLKHNMSKILGQLEITHIGMF